MAETKIETCPRCAIALTCSEVGHVMCRACAELDMMRLFAGVLGMTDDWYQEQSIQQGEP